jgi:hypothetical protein
MRANHNFRPLYELYEKKRISKETHRNFKNLLLQRLRNAELHLYPDSGHDYL